MKTFLKAKCRKTGKKFGLEVEKIGGIPYITNFVDLSEDDFNMLEPQYSVDPHIEVGRNLIACKYCRSRKFGNCSCNKSRKRCSISDDYDFQCVYCDELEIDYSGAKDTGGSIYNKVNLTNLPASAFDRHGNPQGDQFDLAKDGSMKGYRVVILNCCSQYLTTDFSIRVLQKKGFEVMVYTDRNLPSPQTLRGLLSDDKTQCWLISGSRVSVSRDHIDVIVDAYKNGHGLYLWGDNDPWYADVNAVLERTHRVKLYGNIPGAKNVSIQRSTGGPGIIPNHPISTGIINFYEGVTVSVVPCNNGLKPLVYGSEANIVTAYDDSNRCRLLVDGGFTRLYIDTDKAGTDRYVVNAAIWLANLERFGHRMLPRF